MGVRRETKTKKQWWKNKASGFWLVSHEIWGLIIGFKIPLPFFEALLAFSDFCWALGLAGRQRTGGCRWWVTLQGSCPCPLPPYPVLPLLAGAAFFLLFGQKEAMFSAEAGVPPGWMLSLGNQLGSCWIDLINFVLSVFRHMLPNP